MQLTDDEVETVATACEQCEIAPRQITTLAERFLPDAEYLVREYQTEKRHRHAIATALLHSLNEERKSYDFVRRLFQKIDWDEDFRATVGPVLGQVAARAPEHEAFLYARDNVIAESEFRKVMDQTGRKICCLVAEHNGNRIFGTGFLISPRHILTAMHVFDELIATLGKAEVARRFRAVFDYDVGELTLSRMSNASGDLRTVRFAEDNWLLAASPRFEKEGELVEIGEEHLELACKSLDFAVVKLAEPVGRERVDQHGTQPRGWFNMSDISEADYDPDSQVAIWQHPFGHRRHFALGRIERTMNCGHRIIVKEASTGKGASGGPCLRLDTGVVGVHVAAYRPNVEPEGTQAIRFDKIRDAVAQYFANEPRPERVRPWKVDDPGGSLVPIIGRNNLISWLMNGLRKPTGELRRNERVYAALPADKEDATGLSFSAEVLESMVAGEPNNPLILLGGNDLTPITPEDFAIAIGVELGIPEAKLRAPPPRPSAMLPLGAEDGDKLDRWASHIMPHWFLKLAEKTCRPLNELGRWERVWIALDELDSRPMSPLVKNFVAGLVGADIDEAAVPEVGRRIHWLFLGELPQFLKLEDVSLEVVNGNKVDKQSIKAVLDAVCQERSLVGVDVDGITDRLFDLITPIVETRLEPATVIAQQLLAIEIENLLNNQKAA